MQARIHPDPLPPPKVETLRNKLEILRVKHGQTSFGVRSFIPEEAVFPGSHPVYICSPSFHLFSQIFPFFTRAYYYLVQRLEVLDLRLVTVIFSSTSKNSYHTPVLLRYLCSACSRYTASQPAFDGCVFDVVRALAPYTAPTGRGTRPVKLIRSSRVVHAPSSNG